MGPPPQEPPPAWDGIGGGVPLDFHESRCQPSEFVKSTRSQGARTSFLKKVAMRKDMMSWKKLVPMVS